MRTGTHIQPLVKHRTDIRTATHQVEITRRTMTDPGAGPLDHAHLLVT